VAFSGHCTSHCGHVKLANLTPNKHYVLPTRRAVRLDPVTVRHEAQEEHTLF
jgi:hypothetical protein